MATAAFSRNMMMMMRAPASATGLRRCAVQAPRIVKAVPMPNIRGFASMGRIAAAVPKKYTPDHEYVALPTSTTPHLTIGISSHAASSLGDIVYLELPQPGTTLSAGDSIGTVESVKSASDILSPVSGTVVEVNTYLLDHPGKLSSENAETTEGAEGEAGWLVRLEANAEGDVEAELESLMDGKAYEGFVKGLEDDH